jgi:hypothetical protein
MGSRLVVHGMGVPVSVLFLRQLERTESAGMRGGTLPTCSPVPSCPCALLPKKQCHSGGDQLLRRALISKTVTVTSEAVHAKRILVVGLHPPDSA